MADWSLPTTSSTYINYTAQLDARLKDLAYGLDPAVTTASNILTNYTRWNSATARWEKYNGTSWNALASSYAINITGSAATLGSARAIALSGDATGTANFDGSASISIAATLAASGISAAQYGTATQVAQITFDAKGRATAAANVTVTPAWTSITSKPTTLSGYGITDSVGNGGSTPSITSGVAASRSAAGTTGRLYIATDTGEVSRDTGSAWELMTPAYTGDVTKSAKGTALTLATSGVTAGTYTKITVDAKGRAIAGALLVSADVTTALGYAPPTPTGTGASGTWGINITGNAASATQANSLNGTNSYQIGGLTCAGTMMVSNLISGTYSSRLQVTTDNSSTYIQSLNPSGTGPATLSFYVGTLGAASFDTSGNFNCAYDVTAFSDERLKTNWRDLGADFVAQLANVKMGVYDRTDAEVTQVGVSAQSLQKLMPNAINKDDRGYLSIAYGNAAMASCVALARELVALRKELADLKV